ncbi:hypothetical protein, unlikely [Trypanosoma brucei gambiense DAL972]|uniref:Uncharacterized protein n=1 Tax=Trypanosoma brucei gambiense (strain MHOM/CI/86/DAL972) TaxID=679716 RepID=C9ZU84_TRYB9|nr:hypothetical protein, unlikely [Trypanosoma brucei gambiense DAL972]CBH12970.1 hypothetical protein, unlikely [Trypanosoma brucei gambiense DAL972]|eukprot:XP_011775249.1 hypothetical protein, unlikely [Trypanosoma brucei gambiense DAL972]
MKKKKKGKQIQYDNNVITNKISNGYFITASARWSTAAVMLIINIFVHAWSNKNTYTCTQTAIGTKNHTAPSHGRRQMEKTTTITTTTTTTTTTHQLNTYV